VVAVEIPLFFKGQESVLSACGTTVSFFYLTAESFFDQNTINLPIYFRLGHLSGALNRK
jgi:hypothetical protein